MDFVLFCFLFVLVGGLVGALVVQHRRHRRLFQTLVAEIDGISVGLGRVAFGVLNQKLAPRGNQPLPREAEASIERLRRGFSEICDEPLNRVCYVGTDAWAEGVECARIVGRRLSGQGRVSIVVTSSLANFIMSQRHRGFSHTLAIEFPRVQLVETFEGKVDHERVLGWVVQQSPHLDAIYITGNSVAAPVVQGMERSGQGARVFTLCHDVDQIIAGAIQRGAISASLACSTLAQGRDSILHLFNAAVTGVGPSVSRLLLPLVMVDKNNIDAFWDFGSGTLRKDHPIHATTVTPGRKPEKPLRFVVLSEDWNLAFQQMNQGVAQARDLLRAWDVEIVHHILNQSKRPVAEVLAEARAVLEQNQRAGLDGIVSYVGLRDLVPLLNEFAGRNIPVATYNSEPLGMRSLLKWLAQSALTLERFSLEYQTGQGQINEAVQLAVAEVDGLFARVEAEGRSAGDSAQSVKDLANLADEAAEQIETQARAQEETNQVGQNLSRLVDSLDLQVRELTQVGAVVRTSEQRLGALLAFGDKILGIVAIIDDIAERTNLLAFNAAVEAAHAGTAGRGFKVIAEEIRLLADRSTSSTRDVTKLVREMSDAIVSSQGAVQSILGTLEHQIGSVTEAQNHLGTLARRLLQAIETLQSGIAVTVRQTDTVRVSTGQLERTTATAYRIAQENAGSAQQLGSVFTEISAQFRELHGKTTHLTEIVEALKIAVDAFNAG